MIRHIYKQFHLLSWKTSYLSHNSKRFKNPFAGKATNTDKFHPVFNCSTSWSKGHWTGLPLDFMISLVHQCQNQRIINNLHFIRYNTIKTSNNWWKQHSTHFIEIHQSSVLSVSNALFPHRNLLNTIYYRKTASQTFFL